MGPQCEVIVAPGVQFMLVPISNHHASARDIWTPTYFSINTNLSSTFWNMFDNDYSFPLPKLPNSINALDDLQHALGEKMN